MGNFSWKDCVRPILPPVLAGLYRTALIRSGRRAPKGAMQIPRASLERIFPSIGKTEFRMDGSQLQRGPGTLPVLEYLLLSAICAHCRPRRIFEIGTFRGSSTLALALNSPDEAEVFTLDLNPASKGRTRFPLDIGGLEETAFTPGELFLQTPSARKIRPLYGDSALFDFRPFRGDMDLVFIDGNHGYENVHSDSRQAFRMLRPGGVILWDDYCEEFPSVVRCLNEIHASRPLLHIARSRLVLSRSP